MKILEVIPIIRGLGTETLSYFTGSDIPIGSIIKVPLRKKIVSALIINIKNIEDLKTEIKNSSFSLKKISEKKYINLLNKNFLDAVEEMANYYAGSISAILNSLIPKTLLNNTDKIDKNINKINIEKIINFDKKIKKIEKFIIQADDEYRYAEYKNIIREEFAKKSSVFFCLPTIQDIKKAKDFLQKGIEHYTFILYGSMNKKEIIETVNKILEEKHPLLIISTGNFFCLPRNDIGTIILDKENSRHYKMQIKPYIDIRKFAETFAEKTKIKIILGDSLLRIDTIWRQKKGELIEFIPLKFHSLTTSSQEIIDMKSIQNNTFIDEKINNKKVFKILSEDLEKKIKENIENNEHLFIFTGRRGLFPSTICADCGNIVKCNVCKGHLVLHKSNMENFFLCHKCGEKRSALEKCFSCNGWRLITLGIGSELVEEKIKELYFKFYKIKSINDSECLKNKNFNFKENIFRIDIDATSTHKKAQNTADKFYNSPQGILIGTEMALSYLTKKIENSAIVSIDSFFSIPDFRINEKILNILLKIKSITEKNFIIQTRDISQKVFDYVLKENLIDFYKNEIIDREKFNFPPFIILIKISILGTKNEILKLVENIQKMIEPYEIDIFPAFFPTQKGNIINGIIKIPKEKWPDKNLSDKLKILPRNVLVNIEPDSLM
ncbi:MAG: hypothetical protein V1910_00285 [bacterium]